MPYPPYVLTRAVSVGGSMTLVGAENLRMILTLTASRSLVWDATGYRFEKRASFSTPPSEPGGEIALVLPRTDVAGWRDGVTGAVIDVSAPDSHTHTYTGAISFLTADNKATNIAPVQVGPFVLPEGDGSPVDLDKAVPVGTVAGQALAVPDTWSQLVAAAQQAAQDAADTLAGIATPEVAPVPDTLPQRTAAGTVRVAEPLVSDDAVPRAWAAEVAGNLRVPLTGVFQPYTAPAPTSTTPESAVTAYGMFVSQVDAALGSAATKATIGTSGGASIHAYTAGAAGAPHAVLVGGTHPWEMVAVSGARAWFVAFATSQHPVMVALRKRLRVTWVPVLSSGTYSLGRTNPNGVNLNRNLPANWATFWTESAQDESGTAPFSEAETQALKALIDSDPLIACVVDCHTAAVAEVEVAGPPTWIQGGRDVANAALATFRSVYDPTSQYVVKPYRNSNAPTIKNWAARYLRWTRGQTNASALIIEVNEAIGGTERFALNAEAARVYGGIIQSYFTEWIATGQSESTPLPFTYRAHTTSTSTGADDPIAAGGRLISSATFAPVRFTFGDVDPGGQNYLAFAVNTPGRYVIHYDLVLQAVAGTPEVWARLYHDPFKLTGDATQGLFRSDRRVTLAASGTATLTGWDVIDFSEVPDDNFWMAQLHVRLGSATGSPSARLYAGYGAHIRVEHTPATASAPRPVITRNAQ